MTEPRRQRVNANGVSLNVYSLGEQHGKAGKPPMVMLHGIRDVALSLLPVATTLAEAYPVHLLDLRGHGLSDKPGGYAMVQYVYDLHVVISELVGEPAVLFGHSLGGHVVCRVAALYPHLVRAIVVVEGLGPPAGRQPADPDSALKMEGERILATLGIPETQRPLPDVDFAAERLLANNPRLDPDRAREIARLGTVRNEAGELNWAFDPRVQTVFTGSDGDASERYWARVRCPVCVISGALAGEYWGHALAADADWSGDFAPGELEDRIAIFPDAEHVAMPGSGHMVHFDEPDALAEATLDFLRRRL